MTTAPLASRPPTVYPSFVDSAAAGVYAQLRPPPLTSSSSSLSLSSSTGSVPRAADAVAQLINVFSQAPVFFRNLRNPTDRLCFELALGLTAGSTFNSRVRPSDWLALRAACERTPQDTPKETSVMVKHWFDNVPKLAARHGFLVPPAAYTTNNAPPTLCIVTDSSAQTLLSCHVHTLCAVHTLSGKALDYPAYDTRLMIRYEQAVDVLLHQLQAVPTDWSSRIRYTRDRYVLTSAPGWAIDLSLGRDDCAPDDVIYEVTIQLTRPREQLPIGPEPQLRDMMGTIGRDAWNCLVLHMNRVSGRRREIGDAHVIDILADCQEADDVTTRRLHSLAARAAGHHGATQRAFAAPPVTELTRDIWTQLAGTEVWIAEKTRGARVLLVLTADLGVHVINSMGTCFSLSSWQEWSTAVCARMRGPTVFDCELTTNVAPGKADAHVVVLNDLMMDSNAPCAGVDFDRRRTRLRELTAELFGAASACGQRPFGLRVRRYVPREYFLALTERMAYWLPGSEPRERVIHYDDKTNHFLVDGLLVYAQQRTYEWRPAWKCTVDFFGERQANSDRVKLFAATDGTPLQQVSTITLEPAQLAALARIYLDSELQSRHGSRGKPPHPMVECRYCPDRKQWVLVRFRTDKTQPDNIRRVVEAMQALIKPLQFSEFFPAQP